MSRFSLAFRMLRVDFERGLVLFGNCGSSKRVPDLELLCYSANCRLICASSTRVDKIVGVITFSAVKVPLAALGKAVVKGIFSMPQSTLIYLSLASSSAFNSLVKSSINRFMDSFVREGGLIADLCDYSMSRCFCFSCSLCIFCCRSSAISCFFRAISSCSWLSSCPNKAMAGKRCLMLLVVVTDFYSSVPASDVFVRVSSFLSFADTSIGRHSCPSTVFG